MDYIVQGCELEELNRFVELELEKLLFQNLNLTVLKRSLKDKKNCRKEMFSVD